MSQFFNSKHFFGMEVFTTCNNASLKQSCYLQNNLKKLNSLGYSSTCELLHVSFLAHLAKGKVSFCHHLASVNFSHFNLLL